jgi:predicted ATPase
MITGLKLKLGSAPGQPPVRIEEPAVTVFVGPNNSGKSQVLREIASACQDGGMQNFLILDTLTFESVSAQEAEAELERIKSAPRMGENISASTAIIEANGNRLQLHIPHYVAARCDPNAKDHRSAHYAQYYARFYTLNLDGPSRIGLVNAQPRGDLKSPTRQFARLLTQDARRAAFRSIIHDALGLYLGIDMSEGDQLHLRFGDTPPVGERTVEDSALAWMRSARSIDAVSDGVKAFAGIILQLRAGDPRIVIIDEPEAFLHPALAFKLGKEIAKTATESGKHLFVATHSPQFLMGTIQSGARVNIVRLTYDGGVGTARLLPTDDLRTMMRDPLLRSVNVLSGLFYDHVIVTEADADRAFYQEINERLLEASDRRGVPEALFLNANGKDTIHRVVAPLRRLGIPAACVVDIDILQQGGANWTNHLKACGLPASQHQPMGTQRASAWEALTANDKKPKVGGGVSLILGPDREALQNLLDQVADYGLFVVPVGEVEQWLAELQVRRAKETWLKAIFEAMGDDPSAATFVKPTEGDVWEFIGRVRAWLANPHRKGIAATTLN